MKNLLLSLILILLSFQVSSKNIYVAKTGLDTYAGTLASPYLTIQKAASVAVAGDVVNVSVGTYRETIIPTNSGTSASPIIFQPNGTDVVTISGAELVTGWTNYSGNIYKATLANAFIDVTHNQSDQIFVGGAMMNLARWPNYSTMNPSFPDATGKNAGKATLSSQVTGSKSGNVTTVTFTSSSTPPSTATGAELYMQPDNGAWSWTETGVVTAVSRSSITYTTFNGRGRDAPSGTYASGARFYLFNKLSLLDAAGEWFHDKTANLLYLWAPTGVDPISLTVEAKKREFAFDLSNKSYITISGFNLFACNITTDNASGGSNKGYDVAGAIIYPWRGAGYKASSTGCVVDGINAKFLSHYTDCSGHFFLQWGQSTGIVLSGTNHIIRNSVIQYSAGNGITLIGDGCKALNNNISDVDYNSTDCSGINTAGGPSVSQNHEIGYNTITRTGRSSITPRNNINSSKSNFLSRVHHNDLSNFMLQDWDGGGLYTAGDCGMMRIDHNIVHDATGYTVGGIYTDWSKNAIVDHNVVYNVEWGLHFQQNFNTGATTDMSNMICYNNTIAVKNTSSAGYGPFGFASSGAANTQLGTICKNNINVYNNAGNLTKSAGYYPYTNSLCFDNATKANNLDYPIDPKFSNFVGADLSLQATSPAINAGVALTAVTLDGYTVPAYNDPATGAVDQGAYEYGQTKWTAGYGSFVGTYIISGTVTISGAGLVGVIVSDGTRTATTDASGNYTIAGVPAGNYTLTPSKTGYTFSPATISAAVSNANLTAQNFTATAVVASSVISENFDSYAAGSLPTVATGSTLNAGIGWLSGQGWSAASAAVINANSLTIMGYGSSGARLTITGAAGATRVLSTVKAASTAVWVSFKIHALGTNNSIYISFKNGSAENFTVNPAQNFWRINSWTPPASPAPLNATAFYTVYLLVDPASATDKVKGWFNKTSDPTGTATDMAGNGNTVATDVSFDRLVFNTWGSALDFDNLIIGTSWSDVSQVGIATVLDKSKLENVNVYSQNGQILANLQTLVGQSVISIIDSKGAVVTSARTSNSLFKIKVSNKGLYLVYIQNNGKSFTQKVVLN
ncbi:MAG: carboxypeptidase regulatory-like domain-containing protein [Paludibacter sp.]